MDRENQPLDLKFFQISLFLGDMSGHIDSYMSQNSSLPEKK